MITTVAPLREAELFSKLTEEELSRLTPLCSPFVVIEDAVLFTEGRPASHLYLVTEGQRALQKSIRVPHATRSRRTVIAICRPGDVAGWSALVQPYRYAHTALAWESSRLISVDARMLRRALDVHLEMGNKILKSLSEVIARRLGQTTGALINERELSIAGLTRTPRA